MDHSGEALFLSGLLAGWLMGLLTWLVTAARDTISQIVIVWLVTLVIGFAQLHHVVVASAEVLAGLFAGQGLTAGDFGAIPGLDHVGQRGRGRGLRRTPQIRPRHPGWG